MRAAWMTVAAALTVLALLIIPATASTAGEIVIHGPQSSSHLRLTVSGDYLLVSGYLARRDQRAAMAGVALPAGRLARIEVEYGPFR